MGEGLVRGRDNRTKLIQNMEKENIIFGIRPVAEAIEARKQIERIYIKKGAEGPTYLDEIW